MSILTIDRLILAINPLKYKARMTRKRTLILVIFSWVVAAVGALLFIITRPDFTSEVKPVTSTVWFLSLVLHIVTYVLIIVKANKYNQQITKGRNEGQRQRKLIFRKEFCTALTLTSMLVVFGFAPHTVLHMYKRNSGPSVVTYVSLLIIHTGSVVDAFADTLI